MITLSFKIFLSDQEQEFILNKQCNYSYAFRKLWVNSDKIADKTFQNWLRQKYNLQSWEFQSLRVEHEMKLNQFITQKKQLNQEIIAIKKEIEKLKNNPQRSRKEIRNLFKLNRKLDQKNKNLLDNIVFGNKKNLKQLSFLNNDKEKNLEKIKSTKQEYSDFRILYIPLIGEALKKGNRYFDFHLSEGYIIYKPERGKKIRISIRSNKNYRTYFAKLDQFVKDKLIAISIRLSTDEIKITFDDDKLSGFEFNKKEFFKERKKVIKENPLISKEELTNIFKNWKLDQKLRMIQDKTETRYCSIDLNPEFIGIVFLEKTKTHIKLIDKLCLDLTKVTKKSGKSSDDKLSKYFSNKRKYEISCAYKFIFEKCKHFKIANFVMEDLNFKSNVINENSKEANRKTKNIWNLNFHQNLIIKHCKLNGIQLIEINPCYTSFIGNMIYEYFDPVNAAIEIGRRGIFKYIKNSKIFPALTQTIIDTMICRFDLSNAAGDVQFFKDCDNWRQLYEGCKQTKLKYRRQLNNTKFSCFSKDHIKSKVYLYTFE